MIKRHKSRCYLQNLLTSFIYRGIYQQNIKQEAEIFLSCFFNLVSFCYCTSCKKGKRCFTSSLFFFWRGGEVQGVSQAIRQDSLFDHLTCFISAFKIIKNISIYYTYTKQVQILVVFSPMGVSVCLLSQTLTDGSLSAHFITARILLLLRNFKKRKTRNRPQQIVGGLESG